MAELIHTITRRALFDDESQHGLALIPDASHTDHLEHEAPPIDYSFAEEVIPSGNVQTLPPLDADYPKAVKEMVREADADRLYVVPPYVRLRYLPDALLNSLRKTYRTHDDLAVVTLLCVLEAMRADKKAAFTIPIRFAWSRSQESNRSKILDYGIPSVLIQFEELLLGVTFGGALQNVIFNGEAVSEGDTSITRFFSIPGGDSKTSKTEIEEDFYRLLRQGGGETQFGYVIRDKLKAHDVWTFEAHNPELEKAKGEIRTLGSVRSLTELFEAKKVGPVGNEVSDEASLGHEKVYDNIPVIGPRDIRRDGNIAYQDLERQTIRLKTEDKRYIMLQENDVCVREIGNRLKGIEGDYGLVAGIIDQGMLPLASQAGVIVLRPKKETSKEDCEVILQYLRSKKATMFIQAEAGYFGDHFRVHPDLLGNVPVPFADDDLKEALKGLTETARLFETWKREALEAASSLFDFPTAGDGRMHVLTTGRRSRQRQKAAERQDDLSYRIQTQFPHPVAYRWRTVAAAKPDLEGYLHILECAEVTTCYLALMAISLSKAVNREIGYLKTIRERIARSGTSLGDWIAILREVRDSKAFRNLPDDTPFYEVMHFMPEGSAADEALQSLSDRRNDQAHGRGPRGDSVPPAFDDAKSALLTLLGAAEFASDYPLRYIDRTKADTLQGSLTYWYRDVMGDHPLVPVEKETTGLETLEVESLYLVDRSNELYLLRPLLNRQRCPRCGTWSTFYLDSYDGDTHTCTLKSMEHSHTAENDDIHRALRKVGLLPE